MVKIEFIFLFLRLQIKNKQNKKTRMSIKRIGCYLSIIISIFYLTQCKKITEKEGFKEGVIKYDINYPGDSLDSFIQQFLPQKMTIKFKNNDLVNQFKSPSGLIGFSHIKNYNAKEDITLINFFNKKFKYVENFNEPSLVFKERKNVKVQYTDTTKEIAGFSCKKTIISFYDDGAETEIEVFYTDQIDIKGFNNNTPFETIDGVLLEFKLNVYDIPMKFKASSVKNTRVSGKAFKIPEGYKQINRKTMREIINILK